MPRGQRQADGADVGASWQADGGLEKDFFEQSQAGLEAYDTDLRVLAANPAMLALRGLPAGRVVGASLPDLDARITLSPLIREALRTGRPVVGRSLCAAPAADPPQQHSYSVNAYPLRRGDGPPHAVVAVLHDVTHQARRQQELDLLTVARTQVGRTLDALETCRELADMAVPAFADAVAVDLAEAVLEGDAPVGPVTARVPMRRAAFTSREGQHGAYPVGGASPFGSHTPYAQALGDLRPRLVPSVSDAAAWLVHDRARSQFLTECQVHSMIVAPLTVHGLVLGIAAFYRGESTSEPFDADDLSLATQLAACAAVCIDNARRFTREHTVATTLQRTLLPSEAPSIPAMEVSHCYRLGRYGAHWFEVLPLSSCRVGLVIGYVPGDGLTASVAMGRLRTAASTLAVMDLPPDELLAHLDDVAQRLAREQDEDSVTLHHARPPFTASCLYLTYDPISLRCSAASAGHESPLLTHPDGIVTTLGVTRGTPLGRGVPHEMFTTELPPGSVLSLYSDGSMERHPAEARDRVDRLRETVAEAQHTPEHLCARASYQVLGGTEPRDGAALLVGRTRAMAADSVASWTFPPEPASVREARRAAREQLARWKLDEYTPATELVVSELATNVVEHAAGPIRLRLIRDRALTVEVSDDADTAPHLRHARLQDEDGRGVFLVASLAERWGTRYEDTGKTIWAEQTLTAV